MRHILRTEEAAPTACADIIVDSYGTEQAGSYRLEVTSNGSPITGWQRSSSSKAVIPRQPASFEVAAVAGAGGGFPAGAAVGLHVEVGVTGDGVEVPPVDVSGVPRRVVMSVSVNPNGYSFSAPPPEIRLTSPAAEARAAGRSVLGGIDRVAEELGVHLTVAVDGSASMRKLAAGGAIGAVARVLTGISLVVGGGLRCPAGYVLLGQNTRCWGFDPADPDAPVQCLTRELEAGPPLIGVDFCSQDLRADPRVGVGADGRRTPNLVYLVTDGVPGSLERIVREHQPPSEIRHLVMLEPGPESLGRLAVPSTKIQLPQRSEDLGQTLTSDPSAMLKLVGSLLVGCFAEGSDLSRRLELQ